MIYHFRIMLTQYLYKPGDCTSKILNKAHRQTLIKNDLKSVYHVIKASDQHL